MARYTPYRHSPNGVSGYWKSIDIWQTQQQKTAGDSEVVNDPSPIASNVLLDVSRDGKESARRRVQLSSSIWHMSDYQEYSAAAEWQRHVCTSQLAVCSHNVCTSGRQNVTFKQRTSSYASVTRKILSHPYFSSAERKTRCGVFERLSVMRVSDCSAPAWRVL